MTKAPDPATAKAVKGSVTEALGKIMADPEIEARGAAQKNSGQVEAEAKKPVKSKDRKP
ncbi:hypothetical protein [Methylobacterium oryzisoli]|uniref:hypothetical protein n=1 Tax=Methylobacterium oryzisoli TaxID=3385502 RepID=UPI00389140EB